MSALINDEIDIALDPATGDIPATGDLAMTSGVAGVVQGARIRLQIVMGEWFLDRSRGIAYLARDGVRAGSELIGQKFDRAKTIRMFRKELLTVPNLVEILSLDATFDSPSRTLTVTWSARTAFGDTPPDTLQIGA